MNKRQKVNVWSFVAGLLFLITCTISLGEESEIVSVGVADLSTVSQATARDSAVEDALRKAVEQAVGKFISSESIVENYVLLSDRVYSRSRGYIRNYKILEEGPKDDLYAVKILANVGMDDIKSDIEAIGILISRMHNPRIIVIIAESIAGKEYQIYEGISVPENTIIEQFLSKGFKVVDAYAAKKTIERDKLLYTLEEDKSLAAKIGLQYDAEIVIMGKATAKASGKIMDTKMMSIHVSMSARAIRADTAEIIASSSVSGIKAHIDETTGAHRAFKKAGNELAVTLIDKILSKWGDETNLSTVELTISGLRSFLEFIEIKKAIIEKVRGVKDIYQRSFTGGVAKLEISLTSDAQTLAETLMTRKLGKIQLDITDVTHNKIHAKVK